MKEFKTTNCPFCKKELHIREDESYYAKWCLYCKYRDDVSKYHITVDKSDNYYTQNIIVGNYYITNYFPFKTTISILDGTLIRKGGIELPFQDFDLENMIENQLLDKIKLWWSFS